MKGRKRRETMEGRDGTKFTARTGKVIKENV